MKLRLPIAKGPLLVDLQEPLWSLSMVSNLFPTRSPRPSIGCKSHKSLAQGICEVRKTLML